MPFIGQMTQKTSPSTHRQDPHINTSTQARLFKFVADAPTVTMQRIKGLTTGGLPTFLEVRNNFHSSEIEEDNVLWQMKNHHIPITFMGDDTWTSLFPGFFSRQFPFPSFNVKDLHTVDDGCLAHLIPTLSMSPSVSSSSSNREVIIAHFLGVDHVGHRFQSNHPAMLEKLTQMNAMLEDVVRTIDAHPLANDTLLVVMGDHGMTEDGNHGGATPEETTAALWLYSPRPQWLSPLQTSDTVHQIDLAPTLSLLLGLPIPFSNIGGVIPDMFDAQSRPSSPSQPPSHSVLLEALLANCWQVVRYIETYANVNGASFDDSLIADFRSRLARAKLLLKSSGGSGEVQEQDVIDELQSILRDVRRMCQDRWTTFNLEYMVTGVIALGCSSLFMCALFLSSVAQQTQKVDDGDTLFEMFPQWLRVSRLRVVVAVLCCGVGAMFAVIMASMDWYVVACVALACPCGFVGIRAISARWTSSWKGSTMSSYVAILCCVGYFQGMFSNSFIAQEDALVRFLLSSLFVHPLLLCGFFFSFQKPAQEHQEGQEEMVESTWHDSTLATHVAAPRHRRIVSLASAFSSSSDPNTNQPKQNSQLKNPNESRPIGVFLNFNRHSGFAAARMVACAYLVQCMGAGDGVHPFRWPSPLTFAFAWFGSFLPTNFNFDDHSTLGTVLVFLTVSVPLIGWSLALVKWEFSAGFPWFAHRRHHSLIRSRSRLALVLVRLFVTAVALPVIVISYWWNCHHPNNNNTNNNNNNSNSNNNIDTCGVWSWVLPQTCFALCIGGLLMHCLVRCCIDTSCWRGLGTEHIDATSDDHCNILAGKATLVMYPLLLLVGPGLVPVLTCFGMLLYLWRWDEIHGHPQPHLANRSSFHSAAVMWFLCLQLFFSTGRRSQFSSLQFASAYVGFEGFDAVRSGFMLACNTFVGHIVVSLTLQWWFAFRSVASSHREKTNSRAGWTASSENLGLLLLFSVRSFFTSLNVIIQRRHLMVWAIFAPKFLFDSLGLIVALVVFAIVG